MIHMHEVPSAQALVLKIQGKLEHADYEKLVPRLEGFFDAQVDGHVADHPCPAGADRVLRLFAGMLP